MTDGRPLLEIEDLYVRYGAMEPVLHGVSLALGPREVVALIGPSGAGKSTLLRAVQRLVEPTSGRIVLEGTEITGLPRRALRAARRRMGMIFQEFALVERLTVMENVLSGALGRTGLVRSLRRRFQPEDVEEAFTLLDRVGLTGLQDRRCDSLSGGQKQRVGIARALIQHPAALLVDEPTASLDPATSIRIMTLITEICEERGLAAIINLHDVPLARRFCGRIAGMSEGTIVSDGPAARLDDVLLRRIYGDEVSLSGPHSPDVGAES
ncbi:MAG: phosphonate ABC transporter ATP-binding protein [Gemmatimonadota bacterium]